MQTAKNRKNVATTYPYTANISQHEPLDTAGLQSMFQMDISLITTDRLCGLVVRVSNC
jgi:hypothetical protein